MTPDEDFYVQINNSFNTIDNGKLHFCRHPRKTARI